MLDFLLALQIAATVADSTARDQHKNGIPVPRVHAVRVTRAPVIDGRLNDEIWRTAPVHSGFLQSTPAEGVPAAQQTEVRVAYDESALYIAARMHEADPALIRRELTRRDRGANGDIFIVSLDTYHDHLTAFGFALNPSGVRIDATASRDEENYDTSWDPVWEGASNIDDAGWTAEMRIPLSQLRFPPRVEQLWGVNFFRNADRRKENSAFVLVKQNETGYVSRFAHLTGISGVPTPRRLEALPYVRGQAETRRAEPGDPFFNGRKFSQAVGVDLKYGLTSNLTLDATVNPDFGQVEADPAQLNLTAFETFFSERRPFFVEGSQIFDFGAGCNNICFSNPPQLFYSRRIGRQPSLSPREPYAGTPGSPFAVYSVTRAYTDVPTQSPILGAAKLTGQLATGTSIGVLHAETGRVEGRVDALVQQTSSSPETRLRYRDLVEPRSRYSGIRVRQDFRGGATTVGVLGTSVLRDLMAGPLREEMTRSAMVGGIDARHRWAKNRFDLAGALAYGTVRGSTSAILNEQLSSARYFDRPDQNYVSVDSARRSLSGYEGQASFSYVDPRGPQASLRAEVVAPGFEANDFGFMNQADYRSATGVLSWRRPKPGKRVRSQSFDVFNNYSENFGGARLDHTIGAGNFTNFQNGYGFSLFSMRGGRTFDVAVSQGGPRILRPKFTYVEANAYTDRRKRVQLSVFGNHTWNELDTPERRLGVEVEWRPSASVNLSIEPSWSDRRYDALLVTTVSDAEAPATTYGRRYVFGEARRRAFDIGTRLNVTFTPNLSFQIFAKPFVAEALYDPTGFKELQRGGTFDYRRYGRDGGSTIARNNAQSNCQAPVFCYTVDPDGAGSAAPFTFRTPDRTVRSLRGTSVLRWEYRPGATVFLVWTQGRDQSIRNAEYEGASEISRIFSIEPQNVFLVKVNYWLSR